MRKQSREHWVIADNYHGHNYQGQTLRHSHEGGAAWHGYFGHPEDGAKAPERVVTSYVVNQSVPGLVVGVTDQGRVLLGEQTTEAADGADWLARVSNPDELAEALEHARVDSARIINELHPPERPHTDTIVAELRKAGAMGLKTSEVGAEAGISFNEAYSELCRLRNEGRVQKRRRRNGGMAWVAL